MILIQHVLGFNNRKHTKFKFIWSISFRDINFLINYHHHHQSVLPKGRSFTANSGTEAAVLPKGRSSTANLGTKIAVLLEMNRCGSFLLFSAPHSLPLKIWKDPRGTIVKVRRVDLANWACRTLKFTIGIKYQFHQCSWPDQRSGNPNHPSPPNYL